MENFNGVNKVDVIVVVSRLRCLSTVLMNHKNPTVSSFATCSKMFFTLYTELVKPWSQDWLIAVGAYLGLCCMKRLEVFLLPMDGMLVHRRSLPRNLLGFPNNSPGPIYTPGWREAL